jgi:chloramphenicol-sensitive protein RarD
MQFMLGVFVFHEHFDHERGITFILIWVALAIYTLDALRQHRMRPSAAEAE